MATVPRRTSSEGPVVIGLGTDHRRDDRCGLDVVRGLEGRLAGAAVRLLVGPGETTALLDLWADRDRVIVVDAVRSGAPPGTIHRLEVGAEELPSRLGSTSTHGLSLADVIALGRSLGRLPRRLTIFGIEAGDLAVGEGLSPGVIAAVGRVQALVLEELDRPRLPGTRE